MTSFDARCREGYALPGYSTSPVIVASATGLTFRSLLKTIERRIAVISRAKNIARDQPEQPCRALRRRPFGAKTHANAPVGFALFLRVSSDLQHQITYVGAARNGLLIRLV